MRLGRGSLVGYELEEFGGACLGGLFVFWLGVSVPVPVGFLEGDCGSDHGFVVACLFGSEVGGVGLGLVLLGGLVGVGGDVLPPVE